MAKPNSSRSRKFTRLLSVDARLAPRLIIPRMDALPIPAIPATSNARFQASGESRNRIWTTSTGDRQPQRIVSRDMRNSQWNMTWSEARGKAGAGSYIGRQSHRGYEADCKSASIPENGG